MLFTIKAALAREQWKRHRANWASAQRSATERGIVNGRAPLGYRKGKDKRLEIDKAGASKVREMAEMRLAGESFAAIGRRFRLCHSSVRQILSNDVYLGIARCGRLVNPDAHAPILTREQFDAVNASRAGV